MFRLVSLCCLLALAASYPQRPQAGGRGKDATIVSSENNVNFDGSYRYSFETSDGTRAQQDGVLKQVGSGADAGAGEAITGGFAYTDNEGNAYEVQYTADENGYQPRGAHLPVPPPIPEAIQRALAYIATAPPPKN